MDHRLKDALQQLSTPCLVTQMPDNSLTVSTDLTQSLKLDPNQAYLPAVTPQTLGDQGFLRRHRLRYPYVAGAMANGISSTDLVATMAENGMIGFFGAGGLSLERIEAAILELKSRLGTKPFGFNLIHSLGDPEHEMATVALYLKHGITKIEAAAFLRMTEALVYYRVKGTHRAEDQSIVVPNQVIGKVSRVEIARQFFSPPPEKILQQLLDAGKITAEEAELASHIPMAQDLTAEADSGGHTDNRPALALLPTMIALKNEFMEKYQYPQDLCVGLGGGISTPESAAAAFGMGAAYILTGSVNQACVEAGICEDVRKLLCQAEQADVAMAPSADMFEIGARVQVLKRGTLFAVRAEKLYTLYKAHEAFEQIEPRLRQEIQEKYLKTDFQSAWASTRSFFLSRGNTREVERAESDPRHKMALVFRSYLGQSSRWAIQGDPERKMDYQVWCGPAMGAFNQWVKGSFLADYQNRRADVVALNLILGACIAFRGAMLRAQGLTLPGEATAFFPMEKQKILDLFKS